MRHVRSYRESLVAGDGQVLLSPIGGHGRARRAPIIVTARRIDSPGQVRFALVYGQHLRKLTYAEDDRSAPAHGYYGLPSATLFRATGCYAFRVSGREFGERLVVRVVA
jgi:hypothetical protein